LTGSCIDPTTHRGETAAGDTARRDERHSEPQPDSQILRGGAQVFWVNIVVGGLFAGAIYALYGLGITLIYKSTRVPNFAHGAVGAVGAYVFYKTWDGSHKAIHIHHARFQIPWTSLSWHPTYPSLPLPLALLLALAVTALLGLAIDRYVMRHLVGAPTIGLIVATVGLLILIVDMAIDVFNQFAETVPPVVHEGFHNWGGVRFGNDDVVIAVVSVAIAVFFSWFFRYTNLGIAIRATADSREVARLLGINAAAVSAFAWAVGSMLACVAGILIINRSAGQLGFITLILLILPGFTAAMFGGFTSMVGTFLGGLVLGVVEAVFVGIHWPAGTLRDMFSAAGAPTFVSFVVVIAVLMTRPKFIFKGVRVDEESGAGFGRSSSGLALEDITRRWLDKRNYLQLFLADWQLGRWLLGFAALAAVLLIPIFTVPYWSGVLGDAVFYGLIALSLVVLIGWTGQLNLCPLAFAGVGAWTAAILSTSAHLPFWVVMPCCGLVAVPFALLIGIPALRLRGFFLALATMAFAFAAEQWLFTQSFLSNRNQISPILGRGDLNQPAYYLILFTAAMVLIGLRNLQTTKVVRAFRAIRDSENTAVAMGIDPVRYKLLAFAVSGAIAGLAGGGAGYLHIKIQAQNFTFLGSLSLLVYTVIAGIALLGGAVLMPIGAWILPTLIIPATAEVNNGPYILGAFLAVRTVIDYPNGIAGFWTRFLRPFHASERVAWASADKEGAPAPPAAEAAATQDDAAEFERALRGAEEAVGADA
jgi:branched-chain amino acid transport system permease protein